MTMCRMLGIVPAAKLVGKVVDKILPKLLAVICSSL